MAQAAADRRTCVVGALILNRDGHVFVHRRSWQRRLFPGCWDIVGGHVEPGEDLLAALEREVAEETGWHVRGSPRLIHVGDWQTDIGGEPLLRREFDFRVDVEGDLAQPRLEFPKHVEFRWLGPIDLAVLDENHGADGGLVRRLVELALCSTSQAARTDSH